MLVASQHYTQSFIRVYLLSVRFLDLTKNIDFVSFVDQLQFSELKYKNSFNYCL
jgi:hypothetical protein